ncbi:MAG: hypothetical protein DRQ55_08590 [Planctomycetota bacterium]|nr:MAG: hypothetical protein DRQ55_08590 [Planctomycetota bacterium]
MTALKLLLIGAGRRVVEDVLPVVDSLNDSVQLLGIAARSTRSQELAGRARHVTALDEVLSSGLHHEADVVYVVVAKGAVPGVLGRLASSGPPRFALLLETPGLLLKHLGYLRRTALFPTVEVAEDCAALPWVDLVRRAASDGPLGPLHDVLLDRSAWRYHGVALLKALLDAPLRSGRRRPRPDGGARVELRFVGGARGVLIEPRDYASGHVVISGRDGVASDAPERVPGALPLQLDRGADGQLCLRLGDLIEPLQPQELALLGPAAPGQRVTQHMHGLKRVGLRRLLAARAGGTPCYSLAEGLDDMAVDAVLEKLGFWWSTPLSSMRSPLARGLASLALRPLARG